MTAFGQWLKQYRAQYGLTRSVLAWRTHYSLDTIKKIENGQRAPSVDLATALATALERPHHLRYSFVAFARTDQRDVAVIDSTAIVDTHNFPQLINLIPLLVSLPPPQLCLVHDFVFILLARDLSSS